MGLFFANMMRVIIWLLLIVALLVGMAWFVIQIDPNVRGTLHIDEGHALADGTHLVVVKAVRADKQPTGWGDWQVITVAGPLPAQAKGVLVNSQAQVVVPKGWVGDIQVTWAGVCGDKSFNQVLSAGPIGQSFGWQDRTITFANPC